GDERGDLFAARGFEEIDRADVREASLHPPELALELSFELCLRSAALREAGEGALDVALELEVVFVSCGIEHRLRLGICEAVQEARFHEERFTVRALDLTDGPFEVLGRLIYRRERIDGVLDEDRAQALKAAPDLDPRVLRLLGKLVDEDEPARLRRLIAFLDGPLHGRFHFGAASFTATWVPDFSSSEPRRKTRSPASRAPKTST